MIDLGSQYTDYINNLSETELEYVREHEDTESIVNNGTIILTGYYILVNNVKMLKGYVTLSDAMRNNANLSVFCIFRAPIELMQNQRSAILNIADVTILDMFGILSLSTGFMFLPILYEEGEPIMNDDLYFADGDGSIIAFYEIAEENE